jgi:hypothetical protein
MATFAKDILYPGVWHLANGRKEVFTPERVRHLAERLDAVLRAGLNVPVCWEHQESAVPLSQADLDRELAEKTRKVIGHVTGVRLSPEGFIEAAIDVPNADDARRLPAVRFVSPFINQGLPDGSGRAWPGESIWHVAVTPRPVQHTQKPFKPVALSQGICLSLDGYKGGSMAEKQKEDGVEGGSLADLVEALKAAGLNIPEEVSDIAGLIIAVKANHEGDDTDLETPPEEPPQEVPPTSGVGMSLNKNKKSARELALEKQLLDTEAAGVKRRVAALKGRVALPVYQKLTQEVNAVKLSLGDDGKLRNDFFLARLAAFEEAAAANPFAAQPQGKGEEVALSLGDGGPCDPDEFVKNWNATLGRK